jgi:transposase
VAAKGKICQFPTAHKLSINRAEGGEGVLLVARKLGISRKPPHDSIKAWKAHGPERHGCATRTPSRRLSTS